MTLTATAGSASGQTTVTVLSGSSIPSGTVLWSATPVSGFTAQKIVQAVPTASGPDLYSVEQSNSGPQTVLVRAFRSDEEQLWHTTVRASIPIVINAFGDNSGELLLLSYNQGSGQTLADLDAVTGNQDWSYTAPGSLAYDIAVGQSGMVFVVERSSSGPSYANYLDSINGQTGALLSQLLLPLSSYAYYNYDCFHGQTEIGSYPGMYGPPMVGPDGSVYMEVESSQTPITWNWVDFNCPVGPNTVTYSETLPS